MELFFFGTGCMTPTKERNHLSVGLEYSGTFFLFDCGEGMQRQIKLMKGPLGKIKKIFISHWHGDHVLGLPGLIQTLNSIESIDRIEIYGPEGSKKYVDNLLKGSIFELRKELEVKEVTAQKEKTVFENSNIEIKALSLHHSIPVLGYYFKEKDKINIKKNKLKELGLENHPRSRELKEKKDIEIDGKKIKWEDVTYTKKGRKISFIFDTIPFQGLTEFIKDSDYLVMEATFSYEKHKDKAEENMHMTARETAEVASLGNVKNLVITHFSQRYDSIKEIENEAKEIFPNVTSSYDLMKINIK